MKGMIKHECGDKKLSVSQNSCGRDMRRYRPPYSKIFQGQDAGNIFEGETGGVAYKLVSCDTQNFMPQLVLP